MRVAAISFLLGVLLCHVSGAASFGTHKKIFLPSYPPYTKPSPEQCEYDNVAQAAGSLTILLAAAEAAGLTGTLQDPTFAGTILAPSNEAFNAAFSSLGVSQQEFLSNSALVARVLSNHILPQPVRSGDLRDGQTVVTQLGESLMVKKNGDSVCFATSGDASEGCVVKADICAGDSYVHVIDGVLLPLDLSGQGSTASSNAAVETATETPPIIFNRLERPLEPTENVALEVAEQLREDAFEHGFEHGPGDFVG